MNFPLVSIIIPTYNRAFYLKLTLDSIIQQTFQDFEIIVVDDGTPNNDNFLLCKQYEKLRYIKIENSGGPAKPRNVGIKGANGKYIAFVDDDDLWMPHKLEKQVEILVNNPEFGLVHCCCETIDENGNLKNKIIGRPGNSHVKHGNVALRMIGNWTLMTSSVLLSKDVIEMVGLFNEEMPPAGEDTEYWTRCSFFTKFYYADESLVRYRVHNHNISGEKKKYKNLSLYLKNVLRELKLKHVIDQKKYKILIQNLCRMQIKKIKNYTYRSVINLFKLDIFWFLRGRNMKLLLFVIIKR
ncbi:GT2 family glycosyltransferase [Flavobacterium cutihirudinis]|uniref:GT2 family glycosyltransferase n=1 Tax=Flavobacterium cutihirudinis TaxID=1265740 RepID=A0A3D9FKI0_9FLAO|nr:glycosyltransferase family A protein [Flavobacterium cutihirudinis]RED19578.1 GT2 family glycosyltransferase [Flavobacterium cutihirudinis]